MAVPSPSTSICLRRQIVIFSGTFSHKSPLFDNFFIICKRKLGVPEPQHKVSSPEWEIYKVSLKALRHEMSPDINRDKGHSLSTRQFTYLRRELSTISDVLSLNSTGKIMHGTYMFLR